MNSKLFWKFRSLHFPSFRSNSFLSFNIGNHFGTLACEIAAECSTKIFLTMKSYFLVPSEPLNFDANVAPPYNTTVRISWSAPWFRNGIIIKYHVYYKKETEITAVRDKTNETVHVVTDLTPYTYYSFWVRAETSVGVGNKCVQRTIMTHEGGNLLSVF